MKAEFSRGADPPTPRLVPQVMTAQEAARQAQEANTYKWKLSERELKELMGAEAAAK